MGRRIAATALAAVALAGCGGQASASGAGASPPSTTPAAPLCGFASGAPAIDKVMVIWEENQGYSSIIGSSSAPYLNQVAHSCGLATNYRSSTHPSLPNYLTNTSGVSYARSPFNKDCSPGGSCLSRAPSIFGQETAAGQQWRGYAESMPKPCDPVTNHVYAARHNPAVYYPALKSDCARWDVPMGTPSAGALASAVRAGTLPAYSNVTPNVLDDMHSASVRRGDTWLTRWLPVITAGPDYRSGHLAILIVWDEANGSGNHTSHVPLIVMSASTPAGTRVASPLDEASFLRTCEQLTGISAYLGQAAKATSFAGPFHL